MTELAGGIRRATFAMPLGLDHVHCYLLPSESDGWTVVDTGLGLPDAGANWARTLDELEGPVERIVVTHFHPDHVGAAADLAALTGAAVLQGSDDYAQCLRTWGEQRDQELMPSYLRLHGTPEREVDGFRDEAAAFIQLVRFARDPEPLDVGDRVDGDTLLGAITPNIGLYPASRPDPLGDFLASLEQIIALAPRLALPGHGDLINDPVGRARELIVHHEHRLEQTAAALDVCPQTAYEVSLTLFPDELSTVLRRFALAETRAHLEYLVHRDGARRVDEAERVSYLSPG